MKLIATNRKAKHDFEILETFEAGIALKGSEVKSLRSGHCSIKESFARVEKEEVYLYNMNIPEFSKSSFFKADPLRVRKLLLHKRQIKKLLGVTSQKGYTLIPLKIYFTDKGLVKIELALAKGKKLYDKRRKIKEKITEKEMQKYLKRRKTG